MSTGIKNISGTTPRTVKIRGEQFTRLWLTTSMSQETFAARIGMKRSGVFRLLRPGVHAMFSDNFARIAEALSMTPRELKERIGVGEVVLRPSTDGNDRIYESGVRGPVEALVEVPRLHGISAGGRAERLDVEHGTVKVPDGWGDFFVRVDGISMVPVYPNQSVAAFKTVEGQQFVYDKDYLIWFTDGECYFSRVYESDEDRDVLVLRKVNPDRRQFPDRRVHRREIDRIARCVGVTIDMS
jgi:hypothetical protein